MTTTADADAALERITREYRGALLLYRLTKAAGFLGAALCGASLFGLFLSLVGKLQFPQWHIMLTSGAILFLFCFAQTNDDSRTLAALSSLVKQAENTRNLVRGNLPPRP